MTSIRKISVTTAILLITATAAALVAARIVDPLLTGDNYLANLATHPHQVAGGAAVYLVAAAGSAGIAISAYAVLHQTHPTLAVGAVVFRAIEASLYAVAVVGLLCLLALGRQVGSSPTDDASLHAVGGALLSMREHATLAGVVAFSIGAAIYYVVFYSLRLVPRWLSGWGVVGVIAMMTACLLALFSGRPITGYTFFVLPIALQEMVLAGWLLVKGFSQRGVTAVG